MTEVNDKKVYVGNLPFSMGYKALNELFAPYGEIEEAIVIADRYSGRSKGFGFVTFSDAESAKKAVVEMNGKDVKGRAVKVKIAEPPKKKDNKPKEEAKKEKTK